MNLDHTDTINLKLNVAGGKLSLFININNKKVQNEQNTDIIAFFAHYKLNTSLQKEEYKGRYYTKSEFYPLSCNCGNAGCNGFHDGIYQKFKKHSVEWRANPKYYADYLSKKHYLFSIHNYQHEILKCWFWIIDSLKNARKSDDDNDCLEYVVDTIRDYYPKQYAQLMASRKEYNHYIKVYELLNNVNSTKRKG